MSNLNMSFQDEEPEKPKRRNKKRLNGSYQSKLRKQLQRVGFSEHEIGLWKKEKLTAESRVGKNLIYARRKHMKYYLNQGYDFREAVAQCEKDRIQDARDEGIPLTKAKNMIWSELYEIQTEERKITGPIVRIGIT